MATYLITQATGRQSQGVIKHLLADGAKVHAVVRDPAKAAEIDVLKDPRVTIFKGESTNLEEIFRAAQGCQGAFLNTYPIPGLEAQQAQTIVDACKKAGIETVVASTTFGTGNKDKWDDEITKKVGLYDYYVSKAAVEDSVRKAGFKAYTILRPGFIHFDYHGAMADYNFPDFTSTGVLVHSYEDGATMPQTDANDIGKYGAAALQNPSKFGGKEIELSNEPLTIKEVQEILTRVSGRKVGLRKRTAAEEAAFPTHAFTTLSWHLFMNQKDFSAITEKAKKVQEDFGIPFASLEEASQRDRELLLQSIPA